MLRILSIFLLSIFFLFGSCTTIRHHVPVQSHFEEFTGERPEVSFQNQWRSWAYVISVYDGDTVTILFDSGVNTFQIWKTRLIGIDAPEVRGKEKELGLVTKNWLADRILNTWILVDVQPGAKLDKFGRLLVTLNQPTENIEAPLNLNLEMIRLGLAKKYNP